MEWGYAVFSFSVYIRPIVNKSVNDCGRCIECRRKMDILLDKIRYKFLIRSMAILVFSIFSLVVSRMALSFSITWLGALDK